MLFVRLDCIIQQHSPLLLLLPNAAPSCAQAAAQVLSRRCAACRALTYFLLLYLILEQCLGCVLTAPVFKPQKGFTSDINTMALPELVLLFTGSGAGLHFWYDHRRHLKAYAQDKML